MSGACSRPHPEHPHLRCSVRAGHDGGHQCHYGDRLHDWAQPLPGRPVGGVPLPEGAQLAGAIALRTSAVMPHR